ncbi:NAD(P)/FAD-dependent oxidoreductase [Peribacillus sp. SCS-37]|uniref:NAD(P)/FAD-dependent oxidoreductase n=1 Tax=Paraperibacillus esterisolvens TaxID=3115296 RepID=UPI0039067E61
MEELLNIMVIGGGYAGINHIIALKKEFQEEAARSIRIILVDQNAFHLKKVNLFKGIVEKDVSNLKIPLKQYCGPDVEFIQGELTSVLPKEQIVHITAADGTSKSLHFDRLVLALGSVVQEVNSECGGITLSNLQNAQLIREQLLKMTTSTKSMLRVAIIGSGITGIETASEVCFMMKKELEKEGKGGRSIEIVLINNKHRVLEEVPEKISARLEQRLRRQGVIVLHNQRAVQHLNGRIIFTDKTELEADACIWTIGLKPHPCLHSLGLSVTEQGKVMVDSFYRIKESDYIYAIGDCIHVVDPVSGKAAAMSCKEAISHGKRLAKIIKAGIQGTKAVSHRTFPDFLCIGLGPDDAIVWASKWGSDFVLTGKLALKIREYTWNAASIIH